MNFRGSVVLHQMLFIRYIISALSELFVCPFKYNMEREEFEKAFTFSGLTVERTDAAVPRLSSCLHLLKVTSCKETSDRKGGQEMSNKTNLGCLITVWSGWGLWPPVERKVYLFVSIILEARRRETVEYFHKKRKKKLCFFPPKKIWFF